MIDLLLLGNGSMQPLPHRWLSSLLVRVGGDLTLFDCGEGTQIVYRQFGWGFRRLSAICFSHWHADHIAGLPGILFSIANAGRTDPVHIYGPAETERVVRGLREVCPYLPFDVHVEELEDGDAVPLPGGLHARVVAGQHRGAPVIGWRCDLPRGRRFETERAAALGLPRDLWRQLQNGEHVWWQGETVTPDAVLGPPRPGVSFGFLTDTRPLPQHADHFAGVDLLVCESTYCEDADLPKALEVEHMLMSEACGLATGAGAKRLLLTHFSAGVADPTLYRDAARALHPGADIGVSGWTTTVAFPPD
jgi:ribonuclease Z